MYMYIVLCSVKAVTILHCVPGNYKLICHPFSNPDNHSPLSPVSIHLYIAKLLLDVNECVNDGSLCDQTYGVCQNTFGSYVCHCIDGYYLSPTDKQTCHCEYSYIYAYPE